MASEVENMFSVKLTPWHKLGKIVHEAPDTAAAIKLAGLDWGVVEQPLYRDVGATLKGVVEYEALDSHKLLYRDTDGKQLGVVGKNYTPLQNSKAFEFFNPFVESGLASFEAAGSLRDGKTIWVLAKLNKAPIEIGSGDEVNKFLLLSNAHDGGMAVRTGFTPIRVVCANTLAMSHRAEGSQLIRVRHSAQVNMRVEALQSIINAADAKFQATAEQYRALANSDVSQADIAKYVELIFRFSSTDAQRRKLASEKMNENITRIFETGYGMDLKSSHGTYWGLYNAVTQYLSYEKGRDDSRLNNLWFGDSQAINQRALDEALKMAV